MSVLTSQNDQVFIEIGIINQISASLKIMAVSLERELNDTGSKMPK